MKFRIKVRDSNDMEVLNVRDFEGFMVSHTDIMEATGNNPFYERGIVVEATDGTIVQYVRLKERV